MKKSYLAGLAFGMIMFGMSEVANATLIERDLYSVGDKLLTYDDQTKYEWLDVTQTSGLSFNNVKSKLGSGGLFDGFTIASMDDVNNLITNGGLTGNYNTNYFNDLTKKNEVLKLISFFGDITPTSNIFSGSAFRSAAYVNNSDANGRNYSVNVMFDPMSTDPSYSAVWVFAAYPDYVDSSPSNPKPGTWLYRAAPTPTPEPATMLLMGTGLAGLIGARRKKIK